MADAVLAHGLHADDGAGAGAPLSGRPAAAADGKEAAVREACLDLRKLCADGAGLPAVQKAALRYARLSEAHRKRQYLAAVAAAAKLATMNEQLARETIADRPAAAAAAAPVRKRKATEPAAAAGWGSVRLKLCVSPYDTGWKNPKGEG
jgi:hypothetical protein